MRLCVEPPENVDDAVAWTVEFEPRSRLLETGPKAVEQLRGAIGERQSCGAWPTAVMVAVAASVPFRDAKLTTNCGLSPVEATGSELRSTVAGTVEEMGTPVHPLIGLSLESETESVAPE